MADIKLTRGEHEWLEAACPYFKPEFIDYLSNYRFKPDQVSINFAASDDDPNVGSLDMEVTGPWVEAILWEVPLMSLLSESYFKVVDRDWDYEGQEGKYLVCVPSLTQFPKLIHISVQAYEKGMALMEFGINFSEFGTRRRRSHHTHDLVVAGLKKASEDGADRSGNIIGTSNVPIFFA